MESFLTILVLLGISAVFNWLKGKSADTDENPWDDSEDTRPVIRKDSTRPTPASPPRPTPTVAWEEELRRLLEGKKPAAPAPPVVVFPTKPPPIPQTARKPVAAAPPRVAKELPPEPHDHESAEVPMMHLASLTQSSRAYEAASHLHEKVAMHMRRVDEVTVAHVPASLPPRRLIRSPWTIQAIALVRNPQSLKQAMLASVILGTPRSLER